MALDPIGPARDGLSILLELVATVLAAGAWVAVVVMGP
jgi:hypothetical protein